MRGHGSSDGRRGLLGGREDVRERGADGRVEKAPHELRFRPGTPLDDQLHQRLAGPDDDGQPSGREVGEEGLLVRRQQPVEERMLVRVLQAEGDGSNERGLEAVVGGESPPRSVDELLLLPKDERKDQMILGREIPVDGLAGKARSLGHVLHGGAGDPEVPNGVEGGVEDPGAGGGTGAGADVRRGGGHA